MSWNSLKFTPAEEWNAGFNRYPKDHWLLIIILVGESNDDEPQALGAASRPEKLTGVFQTRVKVEIQALREPLGGRHILAIDSDT